MYNLQVNSIKELRPNTHSNIFSIIFNNLKLKHSNTFSWHRNASVWRHSRLTNIILADANMAQQGCPTCLLTASGTTNFPLQYIFMIHRRDQPSSSLCQYYGITSINRLIDQLLCQQAKMSVNLPCITSGPVCCSRLRRPSKTAEPQFASKHTRVCAFHSYKEF